MNKNDLLSTDEASEIIGIGSGTLRAWRSQGKGPKFYKAPGQKGVVRYRVSDLMEWVNSLDQKPAKGL